jgi:hypothetical protein
MKEIDRRNAKIIGILFIIAAISSIVGLILYNPILREANYIVTGQGNATQIITGAICELILVVSIIGTAIMLFPYLKKKHDSFAIGYVCFRFLEAVIILIGTISVLALLTLSQNFEENGLVNINAYHSSGIVLKAIHEWTFILGPNFFLGINTFIYSYLFYKFKLIPRSISLLGITGATLIFLAAILEMFHVIAQISAWGVVLALPIFAYEMSLAVWLIFKGFRLDIETVK